MKPVLIHHFIEQSALRYTNKIALLQGSIKVTYEKINCMANRFAHFLIKKGVQKGDRAVIVMENRVEMVESYYGCLKAGVVTVEVSEKSTLDEVSYYIENSGAKICILSNTSARRLNDLKIPVIIGYNQTFSSSSGEHISSNCIDNMPVFNPNIPIEEHDIASIVYTSGSTGRPKGVILTHKNICSNTESIVSYLDINETDRIMAILPFYYVYGKTLLNTHFRMGGSIVINNKSAFLTSVVQDMVEKEVTGFAGVPSTFAMLLNRSTFSKTNMPLLRYITQAGGAMAPALTKRLEENIGDGELYVMYGATEASARLTYLPPNRLKDKIGSIGIPIPSVEITIRDDNGKQLPPYEIGNICAQGPNIMQGYWNDKEETDKALRPWGLVTGDLGYMDNESFIFLTGRKKELLKVGGERIAPKEIEDAIIESGMVHEVAVIGREDDVLSEVPEAFVVPMNQKNFVLESLREYISGRLSLPKQPRYWNILKSLPKKVSGKIDKEALK